MQGLCYYILVRLPLPHIFLDVVLTFLEDTTNTIPNSATVSSNATFAAEVQAQYAQNKTGKLSS